jgi:photosystem II stability/assembly factor-like uncharacterized protein
MPLLMEKVMKSFFNIVLVLLAFLTIMFTGCELFTKPNGPVDTTVKYGNDLIISEVFTVPPDRYYAYSWIEIYNPTLFPINWLQTSQPAAAFLVGDIGTIRYTSDNGESWSGIGAGIAENINAVNFPLIDTGIAVGDNGKIIKINKTGDSYSSVDISAQNDSVIRGKNLNDIVMIENERIGYIVGDSGMILRTSNRGNTWFTYKNPTPIITKNLRGIDFKYFTESWVVGDSGTILKSTRAKVWDIKNPPETFLKANFKACTFVDDTGWVVGEKGAIVYTKTGGNIFSEQFPPTGFETTNFNDVFFGKAQTPSRNLDVYNAQEGYIVGDGGVILHTTNNGEEWTQLLNSPTTEDLNYVYFTDSLKGWIAGANGTVYYTPYRGLYWLKLPTGTLANINAGHFNPPTLQITSVYSLEMRAKRKEYFFDPATGTTNFNVFVKVDTGYLLFDPQSLFEFGLTLKSIVPGGFCLINNDSVRFGNHTKVGPGQLTQINASVTYLFDSTSSYGVRRVLWDLLSSGEIRLVKYETEYYQPPGQRGEFRKFEKKIIDVVRWGNFDLTDSVKYANELLQVWPQGGIYTQVPFLGADLMKSNTSLGMIPEGYSISRYANDYGYTDPSQINSANSFYMSEKPLPGWFSQRMKK